MSISDLVPTLQPMVEDLNQQLRFICFFILTGSIIVRTGSGSTSINQLLRPIVTNIMICALLATLPFWFNANSGLRPPLVRNKPPIWSA